jgi:hypothetical protein
MKHCQVLRRPRADALPERLVRAVVSAALHIAAQRSGGQRTAPQDLGDEVLDELGRPVRQFPSVRVPPAFDEPDAKGSHHVIWYAC